MEPRHAHNFVEETLHHPSQDAKFVPAVTDAHALVYLEPKPSNETKKQLLLPVTGKETKRKQNINGRRNRKETEKQNRDRVKEICKWEEAFKWINYKHIRGKMAVPIFYQM